MHVVQCVLHIVFCIYGLHHNVMMLRSGAVHVLYNLCLRVFHICFYLGTINELYIHAVCTKLGVMCKVQYTVCVVIHNGVQVK